jgi:hypothetical protein
MTCKPDLLTFDYAFETACIRVVIQRLQNLLCFLCPKQSISGPGSEEGCGR